jgi:predicted amidohydrolase YtcJ
LDEASPNKPIVIMRDDCHAYWCNSKILEITKTTHENGIFIEEHMNVVKKFIPKLSEEE